MMAGPVRYWKPTLLPDRDAYQHRIRCDDCDLSAVVASKVRHKSERIGRELADMIRDAGCRHT